MSTLDEQVEQLRVEQGARFHALMTLPAEAFDRDGNLVDEAAYERRLAEIPRARCRCGMVHDHGPCALEIGHETCAAGRG